MTLTVGQRYMTRSGAVVEVVERIDTGLMTYSLDGKKPLGHAYLIRCRIVICADGTKANFETPREFAVHDDGHYGGGEHELDLVVEVSKRRAA